MNGNTTIETPAANAPPKSVRTRSTIEFPYGALDDAEEVAKAVHNVGGVSCQWDQLAATMKQAPKGGGFRLRVMAARSFGLLNYDRGEVTLTELGLQAIDPRSARAARAEAFLKVELFRVAFDKFKGTPLPPAAAIERQFEQLGVAPKQTDRARQVFTRSAKYGGFFDLAPDRLVAPALGLRNQDELETGKSQASGGADEAGGSSGESTTGLHPFIKGLLDKLPTPETEWQISGRVKWLQTAANIFDLMYTTADPTSEKEIEVKQKRDLVGQGESL